MLFVWCNLAEVLFIVWSMSR